MKFYNLNLLKYFKAQLTDYNMINVLLWLYTI